MERTTLEAGVAQHRIIPPTSYLVGMLHYILVSYNHNHNYIPKRSKYFMVS